MTYHVDTGVSVKELQHFWEGFMGQTGEVRNFLNDRLRIISLNHELLDRHLLVGRLCGAHVGRVHTTDITSKPQLDHVRKLLLMRR